MAKRRPTGKTPSQRSAPSKPTRQERRQAARNNAKAQRTVDTTSSLTAVPSYSRQDMLALLALGLMVVVCYLPAMLWGGFVWDDNVFLLQSERLREGSGIWTIWFSPGDRGLEDHYWPLTHTTFWLEHKLWGFDPTGYHIVNVLLHLGNTLLVWHLMRRLSVPGAWVVAAVFAVHPLHVESVAWIIERKDVLSGLFYLAAALAWLRFTERPNPRRYVVSLVLYVAALLSKSIAVTLPAALLIWHWWQQGRVTLTDLLRLGPFFVVGLVVAIGDLLLSRSLHPVSFDYSLTERTLIASRALWFYVGKLLWPTNLTLVYPLWDIRVDDLLAWGYLVAAVALAVAFWCFRPQVGRGPLAGALFFVVTLSPVLGFVDYEYMLFAFVADRYQYLAGLGIMAIVIGAVTYGVCLLSSLWQKGARVVVAVIIVVLGLLTWRQASVWKDGETLNRHIIAHNPQARRAHLNLGAALHNQGRYAEAFDALRVAVEQYPGDAGTHRGLGKTLNQLGRFEEAEKHLRRAIEINPQARGAHSSLGATLHNQGRYAEALEATRVAVEQYPGDAKTHSILGMTLYQLGRFEEAETHLRRAIALSPQDMDALQELAEVLFRMGQSAEENGQPEVAAEYYMIALEIDPHYTKAIRRLAHLRSEQQRYDEALELFQHLIDIDPSNAVAQENMGIVLFYLGRRDEALQRLDQALSLDPTLETARANREALLKAMEGNLQ